LRRLRPNLSFQKGQLSLSPVFLGPDTMSETILVPSVARIVA